MKNIIQWLFGIKDTGSRESATNRMKLMVIHDRFQMPPAIVEQMKLELIAVASKYFAIDPGSAECVIKSQGNRRAFISAIVPLLKRGIPGNEDQGKSNKRSKRNSKKQAATV
ncbi:MAG: cell division topological specificity factor MinE [Candidatus Melainabacteria bacterium]|jgi:cell division topological specificity factor|nr:cell division topological specificity factor MinE [Candidatus Melainabacteria bacterium]